MTTGRFDIGTIANLPTCLKPGDLDKRAAGYHESLMRSYHIVAKLKTLIELGTPHTVILEILALLQSNDFQPYAWHEQRYRDQSSGEAHIQMNATEVEP